MLGRITVPGKLKSILKKNFQIIDLYSKNLYQAEEMKQATRKILASYSSLASCFLYFGQQKLQAQVIYTDIKDTTLTKGEFFIDLDNNGTADFGISISKLNCGDGYPNLNINIHGESLIRIPRATCDLQYSYRPKPLDDGFLIGTHNRVFWSSYEYGFAFNICGYRGCNQLWDGKGDRYVGVRIREKKSNDHDFYYGWIRVTLLPMAKVLPLKTGLTTLL